MTSHQLTRLLQVLRPAIRNRTQARRRLEAYWQDKIAIVWTTREVHRAANERATVLTESEARAILQGLFIRHNQQHGLRWEDLTAAIADSGRGRKMTRAELKRFVQRDILALQS